MIGGKKQGRIGGCKLCKCGSYSENKGIQCKDCVILKGREEIISALKEELQEKDRQLHNLQTQLNCYSLDEEEE